MMAVITILLLLVSSVAGHYAIKDLTIDGYKYLARDARLDDWVGAKRIEWSYRDNQNFTWMALNDVTSQGIACGNEPVAPPLHAQARAGADITIQWTKVPKHHYGPSMSYLGLWSPGEEPQKVKFFKVKGEGYDASKRAWANEIIIQNGNRDELKIPSDIKPGLYILRTELLSLHGNGHKYNPGLKGLPQFYIHCFNIEITGQGNATPQGVSFPGGYAHNDSGVNFVLGKEALYSSYRVPGPTVYKGIDKAPEGPQSVPVAEQLGKFPSAFNLKYQALLSKLNEWSDSAVDFFDSGQGGLTFIRTHQQIASNLTLERAQLRKEAIDLGLADPGKVMQNSRIF